MTAPDLPPTAYRARLYRAYNTGRRLRRPRALEDFDARAPFLDALIQHWFPQDREARILDLACGQGELVHFALRRGYTNIRGVELDLDQVAVARELNIAGVERGDIFEVLKCLAAGSLDCVITIDVLEHLTREESLALADEVRRVLVPGGRWLIQTVNASSPFFGRFGHGDLTHEQIFTTYSLSQLLICTGFERFEFREAPPMVHGIKSLVRWLLWQVIRLVFVGVVAIETGLVEFRQPYTQNFLGMAFRSAGDVP